MRLVLNAEALSDKIAAGRPQVAKASSRTMRAPSTLSPPQQALRAVMTREQSSTTW